VHGTAPIAHGRELCQYRGFGHEARDRLDHLETGRRNRAIRDVIQPENRQSPHEPIAAETLCARLGLHRRGTLDFLDALVAFGMLQRDERGYMDTPETARFLNRESPAYKGGLLTIGDVPSVDRR
jgi:hypothetical protein